MLKEYPSNQVALFLPEKLTDKDEQNVFKTIQEMLPNNDFHISFYRTADINVLKFLLTLPSDSLRRINIHIISSVGYLDKRIVSVLELLKESGLTLHENILPVSDDQLASNKTYEKFVGDILENADECLSFYKRGTEEQSKLLRPLDLAKVKNKRTYIYHLDGKVGLREN